MLNINVYSYKACNIYMMSTKTNYIDYKLIANIKKGDLLGYFLPSKVSDLAYSIETLEYLVSITLDLFEFNLMPILLYSL